MQQFSALNRRQFLRLSSLTGVAFALGFSSSDAEGANEVMNCSDLEGSFEITPYIIIEKSGPITIMNPRPEMGQGTYQSLPAIIAEELEISLCGYRQANSGESQFGRQVSEVVLPCVAIIMHCEKWAPQPEKC